MSQPIALYVHIPFCETRCPYCDFNTYAGIESLMPRYVDALCHDLTQWGAWLGRPRLASLFFGGGTPSYLPTRDIGRLMGAITTSFDLPPDAEATLEANPGDCARERLAAIRAAGVNRLSIGVQSLDDNELRLLGRRHSADDAAAAVQAARQAGFDNLSIDLMFGLPYQFVSSWEHTLERAIELLPDHVSAYALTLEGGTEMEASVRQGRLPDPDPDLAAEMYLLAQAMFSDARYEQYEISNWAAPSRASTHNLAYWQNRPYLGVGPGAHSYLVGDRAETRGLGPHGVRFAAMLSPRGYVDRAESWRAEGAVDAAALGALPTVGFYEEVSEGVAMAETMMMGLRLNTGVSDAAFAQRFGGGIAERFPSVVADCIDLGLLEWSAGNLRLTEEGRLLGNEAFGRFVGAVLG